MKAISPVIATVIIVAVAIAISIAVALWITGLTSSFTGVEKLEIVNAYAVIDNDHYAQDASNKNYTVWYIILMVKNTGTKPATIDNIFINNKPGTITNANYSTDGSTWTTIQSTGLTIQPGDEYYIKFYIRSSTTTDYTGKTKVDTIITDSFSSGQTVSIVIHTASGGQYPATVTLP